MSKLKLNAKQLRSTTKTEHNGVEREKNEIYIILDDVLDTYNIGSVFRLADAIAAKKICLCGATEIPPNHRIKKASINTTEWVEWQYFDSTLAAIKSLRQEVPGIKILAVEQAKGSIPYTEYGYAFPVAVIVGNESYGVAEETLQAVDAIVELPMFGVNISLNVMVSLAIVLYQIIEKKT
jgi:23S rRNA (guanosine2251-2'-O)-methyltransferase